MKVSEKLIKKFQEGGAVDPAAAQQTQTSPTQDPNAGAGAGGQDPMMIIIQTMAQAVQNNDGQLALQACAAFLQFIQSQGGGGAEPTPAEPVFAKNGGKLTVSRRLKH